MDVLITVNAADAQFIYVRRDDEGPGYTVQIADAEIQSIPRWALEELRNRINETLTDAPPSSAGEAAKEG